MATLHKETELQIRRVSEFFSGEAGRTSYERLCHYAESQARRYNFAAGWFSDQGHDILHEVMTSCSTINEDGRCIRNIPPDVPVHAAMKKIIWSKLSHAYTSSGALARGYLPETEDKSTGEWLAVCDPADEFWNAAGDRLTSPELDDAIARVNGFILFTKADHVVHGMLILIRDENLDKPASLIAERLGITEAEVYVARKRLATLTSQYLKQGGSIK